MEKKYVKTNYTGCLYITAGKVYEVTGSDGKYCWIVDDQGDRIYIIADEADTCYHLDSVGFWEYASAPTTEQQDGKMEQEYKTFGELSKEEKLALFEAWVEGGKLQLYNTDKECFVDIVYVVWSDDICYRIKPAPVEMPSIDWRHVHPDYKWLAVGKNEAGLLYKEEPVRASAFWVAGTENVNASGFLSYRRGNVAWDKSLVKRPEGV